jgi:hypothetical protein
MRGAERGRLGSTGSGYRGQAGLSAPSIVVGGRIRRHRAGPDRASRISRLAEELLHLGAERTRRAAVAAALCLSISPRRGGSQR